MGRRRIEVSGWSSVELRHLAALEAVAEEMSFARAAVRLGYTQSAVSQQIAALESLAGTRLIRRGGGRTVSLTPAGERVRQHAALALSNANALVADLERLGSGERGTVRIGIFPSVGSSLLPPIVKTFRGLHPEAVITLTESPSDRDLLEQLRLGELDVAFAMLPVKQETVEVTQLVADPYVALVPASSPLARLERISMSELASHELVGFQHEEARVAAHFETLGLDRLVHLRADDSLTVNELVAVGLGIAVVPQLSVNAYDPRVHVLEIDPPILPRRIGIATHVGRTLQPLADAFVATASSVAVTHARIGASRQNGSGSSSTSRRTRTDTKGNKR